MTELTAFDSLENEEQFWQVVDGVVSRQCPSHEAIDDALREWLYLAAKFRDRFLDSEDDVTTCAHKLLASHLFAGNRDYVRTQLIYSLLQEDEGGPLHVIASFLLLDGRADDKAFRRMIDEACFPRLVELIGARHGDDPRLHRLLLRLMYEMCRMERLHAPDLLCVDDAFVAFLFQIIEGLSDDADDPYHYPIIRVLLVLNEQYMLASTDSAVDPTSPSAPLTNRVVKLLCLRGPLFRTFGENIILLLNRETETSQQLLILKLLYLLCTTKATYEYFYTNDLRVLLDVIIRNLLDLPDEKMSLRHTYLRVLYPLLAHTQLNQHPHYKKDEILRVLKILGGSDSAHFAPADDTTVRLIERVAKVQWLAEQHADAPPPQPPAAESEIARKFLGISLSASQTASAVSVVDVAAVMEKPGIKTPSRKTEFDASLKDDEEKDNATAAADALPEADGSPSPPTAKAKRVLPEVPKHRHGVPYAQTATLHVNGGFKKLPPKAPPPRRTKLRPSDSDPARLEAPEP